MGTKTAVRKGSVVDLTVSSEQGPPVSAIMHALMNSSGGFYTLEGLASALRVDKREVAAELRRSQAYRLSRAADRDGQPLYTLASRPVTWRERLAAVRSYLAS